MRPPASDGGAPAARPTRVRLRIAALLMGTAFLNYFNRISMPVAAPDIIRDCGLDEVRMGWVYSALLIAYTACMLPGGWVGDRWGGRSVLTAMGLGTAAACALTGLVGWLGAAAAAWPALMAVRALMGACTAPLFPTAGRVVSRWTDPGGRARTNGLVNGSGMLGIVLAYPVFGALIGAVGWRDAFLITGGLTGLLAVAWAWLGRDDPAEHLEVNAAELARIRAGRAGQPDADGRGEPDRAGGLVASWRAVARNRSLWLLTASYATVGYIEYQVFYWSEYYFKQVLHFGERQSQLAAMAPPLLMALGMPLGGWLADTLMVRIGLRRARAAIAAGGMVGCATLLWLGTAASDPAAIVACFALSLGAIGLTEGAAWTTAIELGGVRGSTSAAVVNTGGNLGGLLSPVITPWVGLGLGGALGREAGWAWGLRIGCLVCLAGAGLWAAIDPAERARVPAGPAPGPLTPAGSAGT